MRPNFPKKSPSTFHVLISFYSFFLWEADVGWVGGGGGNKRGSGRNHLLQIHSAPNSNSAENVNGISITHRISRDTGKIAIIYGPSVHP